eukprot:COSAG01_NODE_214_length_21729_cov_684.831623_2_plen_77_part_00
MIMGWSRYDWAVLQATENSVPFYESLGFVRVGAVARCTHDAQRPDHSPQMQRRVHATDNRQQHPATPAFLLPHPVF